MPLNTRPTARRTQADIVEELLNRGSTVSRQTALHYNIANLPDVIMRLRRRGMDIVAETRVDLNGVEFTDYRKFEPRIRPPRRNYGQFGYREANA